MSYFCAWLAPLRSAQKYPTGVSQLPFTTNGVNLLLLKPLANSFANANKTTPTDFPTDNFYRQIANILAIASVYLAMARCKKYYGDYYRLTGV